MRMALLGCYAALASAITRGPLGGAPLYLFPEASASFIKTAKSPVSRSAHRRSLYCLIGKNMGGGPRGPPRGSPRTAGTPLQHQRAVLRLAVCESHTTCHEIKE